MEVSFVLDFSAQFDQAGIFVSVGPETWVKAGVELSDGEQSLGAVVTRGESDWSLSPVEWTGRTVTMRASRSGNALTVRARVVVASAVALAEVNLKVYRRSSGVGLPEAGTRQCNAPSPGKGHQGPGTASSDASGRSSSISPQSQKFESPIYQRQ
ncbi:regulation of enolase protein 1 (concanavalin A-like superfamily) [Frigoribacterium sp. 2355]